MLSKETLSFGEEILTATLGLHDLYRAESGDEDGLAVVIMTDAYSPEALADYEDATKRFAGLKDRAGSLPEPDRALYYGQYCSSMLHFIQWREGNLSFEDQISEFLHVPAKPASEEQLALLRAQIESLLDQMSYHGTLKEKCAAWEDKVRVAPEDVEQTFSNYMDEAWTRTDKEIKIPADRSDGMKVKAVRGQAFNARCDYLHRTVELNVDPVLTYPGLKHLVTHEGLPGHYLQFKLRQKWFEDGRAAADGLISVVNTASSTTFEGIADNGLHMIDWVENDDDRVQAAMSAYRSAIGTTAAWKLNALHEPVEEVTDWLRAASLAGGEGWVQGRIRFLTGSARAVLIWSYYEGEPSVRRVFDRVPVRRRPEFYEYLYGRMHSPQSVDMFR